MNPQATQLVTKDPRVGGSAPVRAISRFLLDEFSTEKIRVWAKRADAAQKYQKFSEQPTDR